MENKKYGEYYGELVNISSVEDLGFELSYFSLEESRGLVESLYSFGVIDIYFDVNKEENYSDTLFFETSDKTDYKGLMIFLVDFRPHEFSEESNNCFRAWFD